MKVHLGCGDRYLDGYLNIDLPTSDHSVMTQLKIDKIANVTELSFPKVSIQEVRLHHLFEHFNRPQSFAFIAAWRSWLVPFGLLRIEVPDFRRTAWSILSPFSSSKTKMTGIRHLFGSHESSWAIHCEGWTVASLTDLLKAFDFKIIKCQKNSWKHTYNFEIFAIRSEKEISLEMACQIAEKNLKNYLVDFTDSEVKMLAVWKKKFQETAVNCWGK
ncbi:MAG: hypothetical protein J0L93_04730 [Deltaproteobacteria bacterium]|nr:hypothetical protein [Deltaproteobacteria bacterium]